MNLPRLSVIDAPLLDATSAAARTLPRLRRNHNFHPRDDFPCHRLLNAIEPGSYVAPHRHLDPFKDETMLLLRGRLGVIFFDDHGQIVQLVTLDGQQVMGIDISHGCWHSVLALVPGTIFFEAKAGPYQALSEQERAPWAPAEGAEQVPAYLATLRAGFGA